VLSSLGPKKTAKGGGLKTLAHVTEFPRNIFSPHKTNLLPLTGTVPVGAGADFSLAGPRSISAHAERGGLASMETAPGEAWQAVYLSHRWLWLSL
jgi:hypothetical protein